MHAPSQLGKSCEPEVDDKDFEPSAGERLSQDFQNLSWENFHAKMLREMPGLVERIKHLISESEEYRLDRVNQVLPKENFQKMGFKGGLVSVWRALPTGSEIRPGDWIALNESYARKHAKSNTSKHQAFETKKLDLVSPEDIYWAGTDENEFFYKPRAWRKDCLSIKDYFQSLTPEKIRILCDGEEALITRHKEAIQNVRNFVIDHFDHDYCGEYHGADHWERVALHGKSVARSLGLDPLLPYVFGWVHDSQRESEGLDPEHGARAAEFIGSNEDGLFSFLSDEQLNILALACDLHSTGETEGDELAQACWDADRLDLWRVGVKPEPQYLCTEYAKQESVIQQAKTIFEFSQFDRHRESSRHERVAKFDRY
jgi:uncharacterized protein